MVEMNTSETNNREKVLADFYKTAQNKINSEIQALENKINSSNKLLMEKSKERTQNQKKVLNELREEYLDKISQLIKDSQDLNKHELTTLIESFQNLLDSLRDHANKLIETEEEKLVGELTTTITNITDVTNGHKSNLDTISEEVSKISSSAVDNAVKMVSEVNTESNEELKKSLEIDGEKLSSSITNLKNEFSEQISSQIEKVYLGVTITKEKVNGIIKDTLSRLEENLNRLTDGIDENFVKEVGATQDLIHNYEGKLLETLDDIRTQYSEEMQTILTNHKNKTLIRLEELQKSLNRHKYEIMVDIEKLSDNQKSLIDSSVKQLDDQLQNSKADIIRFNGELRDSLNATLNESSKNAKQAIQDVQSNTVSTYEKFNTSYTEESLRNKTNIETTIDVNKDTLEKDIDSLKKDIKIEFTNIDSTLKTFENQIKQQEK